MLAPASPHVCLPEYVVSAGKAIPIPYNGSVARLQFNPAVHGRVRKWLLEGEFDVLHLHEPNAPACRCGPCGSPRARSWPPSHLDHQIADAVRLSGPAAAVARRSSAGSRCQTWPGAGRWRRSGLTQWRFPTGSTSPRWARRRGWTGIHGRARRCCSSAASTNHARVWRCCWRRCRGWWSVLRTCRCWSSATATRTNCARTQALWRSTCAFSVRSTTPKGVGDAQCGRLLRAQHRR